MTDETDSVVHPERRERQGWTDAMESRVSEALRAEADRVVLRAQRESGATRDPMAEAELMGAMALTALPVQPAARARPDRPAYLARAVRKVNEGRRVSRAFREILGRLVRRANL